MKTDINIYIEHKENGKWVWVNEAEIYLESNSMFGILAGILDSPYADRNEPIGLPKDCDPKLMNYLLQSKEFNSYTYLTLTDLLKWDIWWNEKYQKMVANFYCSVVGYMLRLDDNPDNVRVIIAFNN